MPSRWTIAGIGSGVNRRQQINPPSNIQILGKRGAGPRMKRKRVSGLDPIIELMVSAGMLVTPLPIATRSSKRCLTRHWLVTGLLAIID